MGEACALFRYRVQQKPQYLPLRPASKCVFLALPLLAAACAPSSYMGISLREGAAPAELQQLAMRARAGDKQAQLDLGIRFEEGKGVPADRRWAAFLYFSAATGSDGSQWVYAPPISGEQYGGAIAYGSGSKQAGLPEAAKRLRRFESNNFSTSDGRNSKD